MKSHWILILMSGLCGLAGAFAKEVTLVSNEENTRFVLRAFGEEVWREVGTGKIIRVELPPKGAFEFKAQAPGYIEKSLTLPELVSEIQFTFMIGDKAPSKTVASKPKKSANQGASSGNKSSSEKDSAKASEEKAPQVSKKSAGVVD